MGSYTEISLNSNNYLMKLYDQRQRGQLRQYLVASMAVESGHGVTGGVHPNMPQVELPWGVWEHGEHILLSLAASITPRRKNKRPDNTKPWCTPHESQYGAHATRNTTIHNCKLSYTGSAMRNELGCCHEAFVNCLMLWFVVPSCISDPDPWPGTECVRFSSLSSVQTWCCVSGYTEDEPERILLQELRWLIKIEPGNHLRTVLSEMFAEMAELMGGVYGHTKTTL